PRDAAIRLSSSRFRAERATDGRRRRTGRGGPHGPHPRPQPLSARIMSQEEIEIEITPAGKVTVRTLGIKGPPCLDVGEMVARIVGRIESQEMTREYYEAASTIRNSIDVHERR